MQTSVDTAFSALRQARTNSDGDDGDDDEPAWYLSTRAAVSSGGGSGNETAEYDNYVGSFSNGLCADAYESVETHADYAPRARVHTPEELERRRRIDATTTDGAACVEDDDDEALAMALSFLDVSGDTILCAPVVDDESAMNTPALPGAAACARGRSGAPHCAFCDGPTREPLALYGAAPQLEERLGRALPARFAAARYCSYECLLGDVAALRGTGTPVYALIVRAVHRAAGYRVAHARLYAPPPAPGRRGERYERAAMLAAARSALTPLGHELALAADALHIGDGTAGSDDDEDDDSEDDGGATGAPLVGAALPAHRYRVKRPCIVPATI